MTFTLRPYQIETVDAVHRHICEKDTNPCVVLPTGSGKSIVMAAVIQKWYAQSPWVRGCVLAHRKELVTQNAEKLRTACSMGGLMTVESSAISGGIGNEYVTPGEIGIFSAGLGKRDYESPILFASIDSIFKRSGDFAPFNFLFVDEAHRIPPSGDGKYRTFIEGCRRFNKQLRVVGFTATPYRMGCGDICHKDHILNEVCYDAKVTDLISQGFLCDLKSKVGTVQPKLENVKRNHGGDYITKSLSDAANRHDIVAPAIAEAVRFIKADERKSVIFFCVDIKHCQRVSEELRKHGINAPFITSKTPRYERDRLICDFRDRRINAVCNVNVLTEGFDAPHIDCIVLLRPTLSAGLYSQMVGRGLRLFHSKAFCRVLDYGGCIDEHGPIDLLGGEPTVSCICGNCRESFSRAILRCPECGWVIPKIEVERIERKEAERRMHGREASAKSILSGTPEIRKVDAVFVRRHKKSGSPDSLCVQYRCGLSMYREWICLDHEGFAGQRGMAWWSQRGLMQQQSTVSGALENLFLTQQLLEWTKTITVIKRGKFWEIINYNQEAKE